MGSKRILLPSTCGLGDRAGFHAAPSSLFAVPPTETRHTTTVEWEHRRSATTHC